MPKKKQPQQPQQQFKGGNTNKPKGKSQTQQKSPSKPSAKPTTTPTKSKRLQIQTKQQQLLKEEAEVPAATTAADNGMSSFFGLLEQAAVVAGGSDSQSQSAVPQKGVFETNFLWCITRLIGHKVEVHTRDGTIFDGVLYSVHQSEKMGLDILLQYATVRPQESTPTAIMQDVVQVLKIPHTEFVQIVAKNISKASENMSTSSLSSNYGVLKTDREIGALNKKGSNEQDLVPWMPEGFAMTSESSGSLDDVTLDDYKSEGWDQIAVNREKFGVKCTYDEEIYTTHLDKEAPEYEERNARAAIIAREIESESSTNIHVLEDRGKNVAGELSEEAMYSAATKVVRKAAHAQPQQPQQQQQQKLQSPLMSTGAYVPPHLRATAAANNTIGSGSPSGNAGVMSPKSSPQVFITPASPKSSKPIVEYKSGFNSQKDPLTSESLRVRNAATSIKGANIMKANSPLHSPLVGNPTVIQGLDLDTSRPKIDEITLDRYHNFNNQKEPSKGAIIEHLRKSSEELNVKVKHSKPSLSQLSTTNSTDSVSISEISFTVSTGEATKSKEQPQKDKTDERKEQQKQETENKLKNEQKQIDEKKESESAKPTTTTFSIPSSPSKTSFKMGGTIFKPKAKVLEPKYSLSIRNLYLDAYKYDHNDTYPSWPQQTQNMYQQQQQPPIQLPPQQFAPMPIAYGYPYGAYYAQPTYYQPTFLQPGYPPYGYN